LLSLPIYFDKEFFLEVNNKTYSIFEGANKSKILERYLNGRNEQGEVSMMNFMANIENSSMGNRNFQPIDLVSNNKYSIDQMLTSQRDLNQIISRKL
jgi:hypothetical protein